jgi:hypothetical protein
LVPHLACRNRPALERLGIRVYHNPGNALKGTYFERGSALCLRALLAASVTDVRMVGAAGATAVLRRLDALRTANQVMRHV